MTTVLVVEDDEKSRRLLADVLAARGYAVSVYECGEDALAAPAAAPDLAVLDIHLPGIDGVETLLRLRAGAFGQRPAVAVTASVMSGDLARLHGAGFDTVLQKPLRLRDFLDTVQRLLAASDLPKTG